MIVTRYGLGKWWGAMRWWWERRCWLKLARVSLSLPKAIYYEARGGVVRRG
jgi:hypothetical protein